MNEQQINIAIAEAVGWRRQQNNSKTAWFWVSPSGGWFDDAPYSVPNFCGDLNAIHAAEEKVLLEPFSTEENDTMAGAERIAARLTKYRIALRELSFGLGEMWHATALQRATAFVRALNIEPKSK